MRAVLIFATCLIVAAVVVGVVLFAPAPMEEQIVVSRIELERPPQPVLQSDPGARHILDFFPELPDPAPQADSPSVESQSPQPQTSSSGTSQFSKEMDRNRLLSLIEDWVYVNYTQVGSTKLGQIHRTREKKMFDIFEGTKFDNGIVVAALNNDAVTLQLGEATYDMRLAIEPSFYADLKDKTRPITPEEQKEAFEYYMRRFGDKFKANSKGYTPPAGMKNPTRSTKESREQGLKEYMERYGDQFRKETKQYPVQFNYPAQQKELYQKYWEKFHSGLPMPDFDQVLGGQNQLGPGARTQSSAQSSGGSQ